MANRLEPIVADILRANGLERQTDTEFDEVANGRIWVYQFPSTAEYQLEVQTVDYRRPARAQNAIDEANSTELFAAHLNIYIAWMANGQRTLLSAGFLQLADSSDGEQLREQIQELLRMPLATYHNAICPMGKFLRCNVDMAQSKHEIDKLKEDNQKLAMAVMTTTMGLDLTAIDRKQEENRQKAMEALKQLAMEMLNKYVNRDNEDGQFPFLFMPLELHCEWFAFLPLFEQRLLIWQLCRGIYAIKGKEVKRKLERLNKWQYWYQLRLEVSADRRTVKRIGKKYDGKATVRAAHPFSFQSFSQCQMRRRGICYFEVEIVIYRNVMGYCCIYIGLCDDNFPLRDECISFAISDGGSVLMEDEIVKHNVDWAFGRFDVIGCGLEIGAAVDGGQKMHLFFTKNGTICGKRYPLPISSTKVELFPAVTLGDELNVEIKANFGQEPFEYDLGKHKLAV